MKNAPKEILKRALGLFLVLFGVIALLVPFFPFAWVALIGLELLGIRALFWDKIRKKWKNQIKPKNDT